MIFTAPDAHNNLTIWHGDPDNNPTPVLVRTDANGAGFDALAARVGDGLREAVERLRDNTLAQYEASDYSEQVSLGEVAETLSRILDAHPAPDAETASSRCFSCGDDDPSSCDRHGLCCDGCHDADPAPPSVPAGSDEHDGCDCTELCEMGPTCPGGMLARLPGSGCWRTAGLDTADEPITDQGLWCVAGLHPSQCQGCDPDDCPNVPSPAPADERERLVQTLIDNRSRGHQISAYIFDPRDMADALLASNWLAAHDADLRARNQVIVDQCIVYRNLAIELGAIPDQMQNQYDYDLCLHWERYREEANALAADGAPEAWDEVERLSAELAALPARVAEVVEATLPPDRDFAYDEDQWHAYCDGWQDARGVLASIAHAAAEVPDE